MRLAPRSLWKGAYRINIVRGSLYRTLGQDSIVPHSTIDVKTIPLATRRSKRHRVCSSRILDLKRSRTRAYQPAVIGLRQSLAAPRQVNLSHLRVKVAQLVSHPRMPPNHHSRKIEFREPISEAHVCSRTTSACFPLGCAWASQLTLVTRCIAERSSGSTAIDGFTKRPTGLPRSLTSLSG